VAAELPFIPKVIDYMNQIKIYLEREHSILLFVTCMLYVYQVCNGVGRCVKDGSCSSSSLEWKLMDSINEILLSQMSDAIKHVTDDVLQFCASSDALTTDTRLMNRKQ